jgi:hypothetical protein
MSDKAATPTVETKAEEVVEVDQKRWFDNGPTTAVEEKRGIVDWSEGITELNLAMRALSEAVVLKKRKESRAAMDRVNKAAHNLNLYLISREV